MAVITTIPVWNAKIILTAEQEGELNGLFAGIQQIASGNEDVDALLVRVKEILDLGAMHLIGLMIQSKPLPSPTDEILVSVSDKALTTAEKKAHQKNNDTPPPLSPSKASLAARILADPQEVICEIKAMWAYLHKGASFSESASELNLKQLIGALQSLPLGYGWEHLTYSQLSELLGEPSRAVAEAMEGNVSGLLKFRLAEVFGWKGGVAKDTGFEPGKAPSCEKAPEGHTSAPPAKNGLPDGEYLVTEARDENGKIVERKIEPLASTGTTPAAPEEAPKKKGRPKAAERPAAPPMSAEYREKLIKQVQAIIDEARTDNVSRILDRVQDAGIRLGKIAELLGVTVTEVYAIRGGKNKPLERKFWKVFSKPNLSSRNRLTEEA